MDESKINVFFDIFKREPYNRIHYESILKNKWNTNKHLMILSINHNITQLTQFILENEYPLYDVDVFRKIMGMFENESLIDIYLKRKINLNDERLYKQEVIEDYTYNYMDDDDRDDNTYDDTDDNTYDDEYSPVLRVLDSPVLFHTRNIKIIQKLIGHGIDLKKNIYSHHYGGALKKAIDYGEMELVELYLSYIDNEHLNYEEWWCLMLDHVSQNGNIGSGAEKCYQILRFRESLLGFPDRLPRRNIFDRVKERWSYTVKEDPGRFRE